MLGISYNNETYDLILNSFVGPRCISECILPSLTTYLSEEDHIPKKKSKEETIISILQQKGKKLSKRELSKESGFSGKILNQVISSLSRDGKIKIKLNNSSKGRPREEVYLCET